MFKQEYQMFAASTCKIVQICRFSPHKEHILGFGMSYI